MRDLQLQIRDYFDEAGDPVSIEDVFFATPGDDLVRPLDPIRRSTAIRRPWLIAAGAALLVVLLVAVGPLLFGDLTTPSTSPPVTDAPTTTVQPDPENSTSTTSGSEVTTTIDATATTTTTFLPVPADTRALDPVVEAVFADLIVAATDIGLTPPIAIEAGLEPDGHIRAHLAGATIRVYPTDEAAAAAAQEEPQDVEFEPVTPIEIGDESYGFLLPAGRFPSQVVYIARSGSWVVDTQLRESDDTVEARLEIESIFAAILGAVGRGSDLDVSQGLPTMPAEAPETYQHSWGIHAGIPEGTPGFEEDPDSAENNPVFVEQSYSLAITPEGERCRFLETPFGAIEPQDYTEFLDDGSGSVSLSRRYTENDEALEENADFAADDPRYLAARSSCTRFEPLREVLDLILGAEPERPADTIEEHAMGEAFPTAENTWVIVESTDERAFDLDPSLLVVLGITAELAPAGVEIIGWGAFVDGNRYLSFAVEARGDRTAIEGAFGVDLADLPDQLIDFTLTYEFQLEPDDAGQW